MTAWEADAIFHAARRAGTFMGEAFMYRLHPQTARLLELIRERRDRRGADDQVELRLRHAGLRPGAPALRQRARRRRHPRRRLLPGLDGAADRRRRERQAVPRPGEGRGRGASRRDAASTNGRRRCSRSRRHHRRGLLLGLARAGERAAHPRHRGADRGEGLLVRLRQAGRHRGHRRSSAATASRADGGGGGGPLALCLRGGGRGEAIRAGRQEFAAAGDELGRHARQHARARQVAGGRRA